MNKESQELFEQYCQYYGYDKNDQAVKSYFEGNRMLIKLLVTDVKIHNLIPQK